MSKSKSSVFTRDTPDLAIDAFPEMYSVKLMAINTYLVKVMEICFQLLPLDVYLLPHMGFYWILSQFIEFKENNLGKIVIMRIFFSWTEVTVFLAFSLWVCHFVQAKHTQKQKTAETLCHLSVTNYIPLLHCKSSSQTSVWKFVQFYILTKHEDTSGKRKQIVQLLKRICFLPHWDFHAWSKWRIIVSEEI